MKVPIEQMNGRIVGYDRKTKELLIRARCTEWDDVDKGRVKGCNVKLVDRYALSDAQRKMIYVLFRNICDFTGQDMETTKKVMKQDFIDSRPELGIEWFSLSNAPMGMISEFQKFVIDFILRFDIPCNRSLIEITSDIDSYIFACMKNGKCCICGSDAELHFIGRDDVEIGAEEARPGMRVLPLCKKHHIEAGNTGKKQFSERYHLQYGIEVDRDILDAYGIGKYQYNR